MRDMSSGLGQLGVIEGNTDRIAGPFEQAYIVMKHWLEQIVLIPGTARVELVVGTPVLIIASQGDDRARDRATTHRADGSEKMFHGPFVRLAPSKRALPTVGLCEHSFDQHQDTSGLSAKTFLSGRSKRSPLRTFLVKAETTDSRSRVSPKVFRARARISEICRGVPAFLSMSSTISTFDVRDLGGFFSAAWPSAPSMRRTARRVELPTLRRQLQVQLRESRACLSRPR